MSTKVRPAAPEVRAEELLRRYSEARLPVRVEMLADDCEVTVARNHHRGPEACFALRDDNRLIVGINTSTSPRRQRWMIAHALGHLLLHDRPLISCYSILIHTPPRGSSTATPAEEHEANRFAAALLMPADLVLAELSAEQAAGHSSRDAMLAAVAARWEVSNEAVGYRLISMGVISG